jgi:hypothetical protein
MQIQEVLDDVARMGHISATIHNNWLALNLTAAEQIQVIDRFGAIIAELVVKYGESVKISFAEAYDKQINFSL